MLSVHVHPLDFTFYRPFQQLVTTFWISWSYNMNQGTFMGPQMDPVSLILGTHAEKKPCVVQIHYFSFYIPLDNRQT